MATKFRDGWPSIKNFTDAPGMRFEPPPGAMRRMIGIARRVLAKRPVYCVPVE